MGWKCIAIGNQLMGDDGIGICVAEKLQDDLRSLGVQVIIGETDVNYCLRQLESGDQIIILDAMDYGQEPGTIRVQPLEQLVLTREKHSLHDLSLIQALQMESLSVQGYLIGIQIQRIEWSLQLSGRLEDSFDQICQLVWEWVVGLICTNEDERD